MSMRGFKIFINEDVLYIYKVQKDNSVYVVAVEESTTEGYTVKNMTLQTDLYGQELEKYIVYALSTYKPEVKIQELSTKEVYDKVDDMIEDISKQDAVAVLDTFVLPEKKQSTTQSILADILQLSYKERSEILVALIDMM